MERLTKAYLRSLPDESLKRLRWEYDHNVGRRIGPLVSSRTWRARLAAIMEEQGRRWGTVDRPHGAASR